MSADVHGETQPAKPEKGGIVLRILLYVFLAVAVLMAVFALIPNRNDSADDADFSVSTTVCDMWEDQTGLEVHGSVRNNGWKPAFNVSYTVTVTEVDEDGNEVLGDDGQPIVIGEYTSDPVFFMWGHDSVSFELKVPFDELRDAGNVVMSAGGRRFK